MAENNVPMMLIKKCVIMMQLKLSQKLHVQSFDQFLEVEGKYNLKLDGCMPKTYMKKTL